ncbi:MAG TPA: hypothetical protein VLB50_13905 [Ignavibacteriaceae bacterium]|nr:hypothetical protein [Ignavibacteriaceae bacterium]
MKSYAIIYRKNPASEKCPSCFSEGTIYRSHSRNWREKFIKKITFLKTFRCKKCGWRGYRSTAFITGKSVRTLLVYLSIAIIIALIVRMILSRVTS